MHERIELLIEVSKTETGKVFISVFKRFCMVHPKIKALQSELNHFDDLKVKEISTVQMIQLLKKFENSLPLFVEKCVVYRSKREIVDFSNLHKFMVNMGPLSTSDWKEGLELIRLPYKRVTKNYQSFMKDKAIGSNSYAGLDNGTADLVGSTSLLNLPQ